MNQSTGVFKYPKATYYLDHASVVHLPTAVPLKSTYPAGILCSLSNSYRLNDGTSSMRGAVNNAIRHRANCTCAVIRHSVAYCSGPGKSHSAEPKHRSLQTPQTHVLTRLSHNRAFALHCLTQMHISSSRTLHRPQHLSPQRWHPFNARRSKYPLHRSSNSTAAIIRNSDESKIRNMQERQYRFLTAQESPNAPHSRTS